MKNIREKMKKHLKKEKQLKYEENMKEHKR